MHVLRTLAFNAAFYVNTVVWTIGLLPAGLLPQEQFAVAVRAWVRTSLWLLRCIVGVRVELRGVENIPAGPLLVAAKHQSTLETLALLLAFDRPAFILKRELTRIPVFGWYLLKFGSISVDRKAGAAALRTMMADARNAIAQGRQIIIFPEGTRRAPGAPPDYKSGIVQMYRGLGAACLPVALNTGVFWPRRGLAMRPGVAVIEMLPALPPDLPRADMLRTLVDIIEPASARLLLEARGRA